MSPSVYDQDVGVPSCTDFPGSIPGLHVPLSTLHAVPHETVMHDSGPVWVAGPSPYDSSVATPRRFIPAHGHPDPSPLGARRGPLGQPSGCAFMNNVYMSSFAVLHSALAREGRGHHRDLAARAEAE